MTQMPLNISSENCEYRGEGNAGLVINLKKEEKVLKLIKEENDSLVFKSTASYLKELEKQVLIIENVMKPLLGSHFVNAPVIKYLKKDEICIINHLVNVLRPDSRKHKSVKEEDSYVFMLPDYCSLPPHLKIYPSCDPVISIEIKPKQGFLVKNATNSQICRYCLMQAYKIKRGVISCQSGYCPTDLFSGCPSRMLHAMMMLIKTPQNNFRMFRNTKIIYSEEKKGNLNELLSDFFKISTKNSSSEMLCKLVIKALLKPFPEGAYKNLVTLRQKVSHHCVNSYVCIENESCSQLPPGCILDRILNVQALDSLELAKLHSLYLKLLTHSDQKEDSVGCFSRSVIPPHLGEPSKVLNETDYQYASRKVWEFLIALTVKDCSIMIVFKKMSNGFVINCPDNMISDECGNKYLISIAIADLDVKPIDKVEKLYKEMPFILNSSV